MRANTRNYKSRNVYIAILTTLNVVNVVNILTAENDKEIELAVKEFDHVNENTSKNIVVHGGLYKHLLLAKAGLLVKGKEPATFENAIIEYVNKANQLGQLISILMRTYPETKPWIVELSKDVSPELYERMNGIAKVIGVKKGE